MSGIPSFKFIKIPNKGQKTMDEIKEKLRESRVYASVLAAKPPLCFLHIEKHHIWKSNIHPRKVIKKVSQISQLIPPRCLNWDSERRIEGG